MTPADEIQTAVTKLHKLLTNPQLTPAPWQSTDRGDRILWNGPGADHLPPRYIVDEPMSNHANAEWIAVMHPAVGAAIANWLAATAAHLTTNTHPDWQDCVEPQALAVARAILGTQETT